MNNQTVSTKELREELPKIRAGLAHGISYTLIYRSKPIAQLEPIAHKTSGQGARVKGGTLRLQSSSKHALTPEYLNKLSTEKYE